MGAKRRKWVFFNASCLPVRTSLKRKKTKAKIARCSGMSKFCPPAAASRKSMRENRFERTQCGADGGWGGEVLSLPHKCSVPGYFNFFSHPTKRVPQFNSIELPPPPAASYLLGGAELKGKRIPPKSDPARVIWRHPICRDLTCVAGARSPKPLQN
jgi:hypothetical protein